MFSNRFFAWNASAGFFGIQKGCFFFFWTCSFAGSFHSTCCFPGNSSVEFQFSSFIIVCEMSQTKVIHVLRPWVVNRYETRQRYL